MEYPNAKISRKVRLAMFISFVAAFFIISPILIMYTAGYRYDYKNGLLRETGSISIGDITPSSAEVYLNGLKIKGSLPIRLNNISRYSWLKENKYQLRLTADGYYDWEKQIEVMEKQTTYIKDINLIKKADPEKINTTPTKSLAISNDGRFLSYVDGRNLKIRDNFAKTETTIPSLIVGTAPQMIWSPKKDYLAVLFGEHTYRTVYIIDAINPEKKINLISIVGDPINKFVWGETNEMECYISARGQIYAYSPINEQLRKMKLNNYLDWLVKDGSLLVMNNSTSTTGVALYSDVLGFSELFAVLTQDETGPNQSSLELLASLPNTRLLKNNLNQNFLIKLKDKSYTITAPNYLVSRFNNWWLFWNPTELWSYAEGGEPYLLNRSGEKLRQVIPLDQFNTLALVWQENTTILFPYYLIQHDFIKKPIITLVPDVNRRLVYYSDEEGLWQLSY